MDAANAASAGGGRSGADGTGGRGRTASRRDRRLSGCARERRPGALLETLAIRVQAALDPLIEGIGARLGPAEEAAPIDADPHAAQALRVRLESLLRDDDTACIDLLESDGPLLKAALGARHDAVARRIRSFDFPGALTLLEAPDD